MSHLRLLFRDIPKLAGSLSGSVFGWFWLSVRFWYFAVTRKLKLVTGDCKFTFTYNQKTFQLYLQKPMDLAVLREIYLDKEYDFFPSVAPKIIIDLGAHFGDTALYYHCLFPDAKIYAVEPSAENYQRLKKNTNNIKNIIPIQAAIGATSGEVNLNTSSSALGFSIGPVLEGGTFDIVKMITLEELFNLHAINKADLIKFDIEGSEFDLFGSIKPEKHANFYIGELHFDLTSISPETFFSYFQYFNVNYLKLKDQRFMFTANMLD